MLYRTRTAALWLAGALLAPLVAGAVELTLHPVEITETKALYGRIESRFMAPARSRLGGTLVALDVTEGSPVEAGTVIARVLDEKLELGLSAAEARLRAAQSQFDNAQAEVTRNEELLARGATTAQRVDLVRTTLEVARNAVTEAASARAVVQQQMLEGDVVVPTSGRVLTVPARLGQVVLPGETVATIAAGGVYLRLAIPERHAEGLKLGSKVTIGTEPNLREGTIEKVYPQIEEGRVIADVAVEGLPDTFIGQRVLVRVPVDSRLALVVPDVAIHRQAGLDLVEIAVEGGSRKVTVVPGPLVGTPKGQMREILTGLRDGDTVITP